LEGGIDEIDREKIACVIDENMEKFFEVIRHVIDHPHLNNLYATTMINFIYFANHESIFKLIQN